VNLHAAAVGERDSVVGSDTGDSSECSSEENKSVSEHVVVVDKSMRTSRMMSQYNALPRFYTSLAPATTAHTALAQLESMLRARVTGSSRTSLLDQSRILAGVTSRSERKRNAEVAGGRSEAVAGRFCTRGWLGVMSRG
jgi:hypothetical protein